MEGVTEFLKILDRFTKTPEYGGDFGARVFKISRDTAGNRLTHLKITGGVLKVKQMLGRRKGRPDPYLFRVRAIRWYRKHRRGRSVP